MRNCQDTFETRKRFFISAFSICMTVSESVEKSGMFYRVVLDCKKKQGGVGMILH